MRWIDIISEGPEEDFDTHKLATEMRSGIIRRFMDERWASIHWGGKIQKMSDGRRFVRFPPGVMGWPAPFENGVFALGENPLAYFPSGFFTKTTAGVPFLALTCVPDIEADFDEAIKSIIHNQRVHEVLLHELIHMIDHARGHDVLNQKSDPNGEKNHKPDSNSPEYYNSPVEFNAYFTNIADKLLAFIARNRNHAEAGRTLRDAQANGITPEFSQTLAKLFKDKEHVPALKKFLTLLNDRNHRRLLSRLYKIHQEAAEILRWAAQR